MSGNNRELDELTFTSNQNVSPRSLGHDDGTLSSLDAVKGRSQSLGAAAVPAVTRDPVGGK